MNAFFIPNKYENGSPFRSRRRITLCSSLIKS